MDNYEKLCRFWQDELCRIGWDVLQKRVPELRPQGDVLSIRHFGHSYAIHRDTGEITHPDSDTPPTCNQRLNVYTLLGYCKEGAQLSGRWVPFREVPGAAPFAPAFERHVLRPFAATFNTHADRLREAALQIGGMSIPQSDAGCLLHAFACIPMQYLFWDGDEEFPAQGNILFDSNVTDFIHPESTVTLASEGFLQLAEAAGLPLRGDTFTS